MQERLEYTMSACFTGSSRNFEWIERHKETL